MECFTAIFKDMPEQEYQKAKNADLFLTLFSKSSMKCFTAAFKDISEQEYKKATNSDFLLTFSFKSSIECFTAAFKDMPEQEYQKAKNADLFWPSLSNHPWNASLQHSMTCPTKNIRRQKRLTLF